MLNERDLRHLLAQSTKFSFPEFMDAQALSTFFDQIPVVRIF
jgi:hypothetical protein